MTSRYFLAPLFLAALAGAQTPGPQNVIRATASASISSTPDEAVLDFGVFTKAANAQTAASKNAEAAAMVSAKLRAVLGNDAEIRTVNYSLQPNYTQGPNGRDRVVDGYTANNTVQVTTNKLAIIGQIIDTAVQAGSNQIQGLRFSLKNDRELRNKALAQAAQLAKAKAAAIAEGLGVKLGSLVSASESSEPRPYPAARMMAAQVATPIEPGSVDVDATVTVEFSIQ